MVRSRWALKCFLAANVVSARPTLEEWNEGQANNTAAEQASAAKEAKMAAVNKVVDMLEGLKSQIIQLGESEAATYNKFACFCKDTTADKSQAIQSGQTSKDGLSALILSLTATRGHLDGEIATATQDLAGAEQAMKSAEFFRAKDQGDYEKNAADLTGALEALEGAIATLKASGKPSLMQMQSIATNVRVAVLLADALGIGGPSVQHQVSLFLQDAPFDPPTKNYDFHSDGIIETLENLETDFRRTKQTLDEEEVKSVAAHQLFMQERTDFIKLRKEALDDAQKEKSYTHEKIASASEELSAVEALVLDDQQYLAEVSTMCREKALTWDQRSGVRQNELSTLTEVINVITTTVSNHTSAATVRFVQKSVNVRMAQSIARNPAAMEAVEAAAEAAEQEGAVSMQPVAFLQKARRHFSPAPEDEGREKIVNLLRQKGKELKSTLLTEFAGKVAADPFVKVKKLLQELIERLLQEAASQQTHHQWCEKATSGAAFKRNEAAKDVERLNGEMAAHEALRDKLAQEVTDLNTEIADLTVGRSKAEQIRAEEKAENENTIAEAQAGLTALDQAIDMLWKFYATMQKEVVDLSTGNETQSFVQFDRGVGPLDDAPAAGFNAGEAYTGAQNEASGILGMMDVMKSDFMRTVAETEQSEANAEAAHLEFMTETGKSLAKKNTVASETLTYKDSAMEKLASEDEDLQQRNSLLQSALQELLELKAVCVDTGMSYADRVANREGEIDALKQALCILDHYGEQGDASAAC